MAPQHGIDTGTFIAASLCFLAVGLVGARLWYVALYPESFRHGWRRVVDTSPPGGAVDGGVALALPPAWVILTAFGLPVGAYFDASLFWLLPAVAVGRFGCMFNGCCAGRETASWLASTSSDHHGTLRRRFPSQLLELLLGASLFALALTLHLPPPGLLFTLVIGLYALRPAWPVVYAGAGQYQLVHLNEVRPVGCLSAWSYLDGADHGLSHFS